MVRGLFHCADALDVAGKDEVGWELAGKLLGLLAVFGILRADEEGEGDEGDDEVIKFRVLQA